MRERLRRIGGELAATEISSASNKDDCVRQRKPYPQCLVLGTQFRLTTCEMAMPPELSGPSSDRPPHRQAGFALLT